MWVSLKMRFLFRKKNKGVINMKTKGLSGWDLILFLIAETATFLIFFSLPTKLNATTAAVMSRIGVNEKIYFTVTIVLFFCLFFSSLYLIFIHVIEVLLLPTSGTVYPNLHRLRDKYKKNFIGNKAGKVFKSNFSSHLIFLFGVIWMQSKHGFTPIAIGLSVLIIIVIINFFIKADKYWHGVEADQDMTGSR
jgi:hypothetical protein